MWPFKDFMSLESDATVEPRSQGPGIHEFSFTRLIVEETGISFKGVPINLYDCVPLSSHEIDGVRKEK